MSDRGRLATVYLRYYTIEEHNRHNVRPGLTRLAQIKGRNNLTWDRKFELDLIYANSTNFWSDVKIIARTILTVFSPEGIGQGAEPPTCLHIDRASWTLTDNGAENSSIKDR